MSNNLTEELFTVEVNEKGYIDKVNEHAERIKALNRKQRMEFVKTATPKMTPFVKHKPYPKQAAFLLLPHVEAFYGGAAGGGKSDCLLMAALQYVDVPGYSAILFRKSYADLTKPGALIDRAKEWLAPFILQKRVKWVERDKKFIFLDVFPHSTLQFGYLENENDKMHYQGGEYQFIGFDELTHMSQSNYEYLFSRLRKKKNMPVPLRVRAASNPGGPGHDWVRDRFIITTEPDRVFLPADIDDNPALNKEEYERELNRLDPVTRAQLRDGNWDVRPEGTMMDSSWLIPIEEDQLPRRLKLIRGWDFASTDESKKKKSNPDPDYTAGCLLGYHRGDYYIINFQHFRKSPEMTNRILKRVAKIDNCTIAIEQEPGSSGEFMVQGIKKLLRGYAVKAQRVTGSKITRAQPLASAMEDGHVYVVIGKVWYKDFIDEIATFPLGAHDDMVDALSLAFLKIHSIIGKSSLPVATDTSSSPWSVGINTGSRERYSKRAGKFGNFGG